MKKRTASLLVALGLCTGLVGGAFAASNNETISALLNRDLKVVYNGAEQHMTDADGQAVYPISYNNTTYLPVRAISGMMGVPIEFNADDYSVNMGAESVQPKALVDLDNTGGTKHSTIIRDNAELMIQTADGLQTYNTGIHWEVWNGSASAVPQFRIDFDVRGYQTLSFTLWSDVNAKVFVYDQDENVFAQVEVPAGGTVTKTYALDSSVTKLGFSANGPAGSKGTVKILDPTVQ